jgi:hypothetical protein
VDDVGRKMVEDRLEELQSDLLRWWKMVKHRNELSFTYEATR